ncbi:lysine N6-hydroxylase [Streptoalloteichus tenebrarius]|uniref:L-lysine N6-monooxygenase MbtG n=1 Tax=Streptoalloteichus tenebrarius (strain ATCC 17920 / DSM 40477 / JCM 4838 / CBS 697.72 / NBRC 16177 / NCIMB 11028 / NRRL B-12390 / A12253. 1 / ISP 5477) TaxID=1933 RepID=A0ABT1HSF6_STRSD|nr:SidA/IucD/PvdA family monooxygenase [Streptoalloteichus tenebrarius]MCP2258413.1 lysine N6-hydroxylase [Streptoalloteichus tenebrarius]BFF03583.1 SidA/IucD/PvdA family monooxygenase [Streptoalloteichus tenebrarius]
MSTRTASDTVPTSVHDVVAVGCGPCNLGLAALASTVDDLDLVVLEARPELRWHPGMMFDDAALQVNFLADLVTLVAPTHPLSFLSYLHDQDRLYPFTIRQDFHPSRREYEDYLRWAAARLPSVRFSHRVEGVRWCPEARRFAVHVVRGDGARLRMLAADLVLGVGTEPFVPPALAGVPGERLTHTADYLHRLSDVDKAGHVTVVGSGQSGAEVVVDLLRRNLAGGPSVTWLTRTPSFAPLDYTKLVLEMTTPAYMRYFHALPQERRDQLTAEQWQFYKGISTTTLDEIHELLYRRELEHGLADVELRCGVAVESSGTDARGRPVLTCRHRDTGRVFEHPTDLVVAATGYAPRRPAFLAPVEHLVRRDDRGRPVVRLDHSLELADEVGGCRVFVANAELHSHGVSSPNLDIAAVRNATILNAVTSREVYRLPKRTAFTTFAAPGGVR